MSGIYNIQTFDEVLPPDLWARLYEYFTTRAAFRYGWPSDRNIEFTHWHIDFLNKNGADQDNHEDILFGRPEFSVISDVWRFLKSSHLSGHNLVRCYANAHTYGVEGYVHKDTLVEANYTTLLYVVPEWKSEWAGETVFMNDVGDLVKSCLPKANRGVIFDGQQLHAARALARICPGLRITLMFKTRAPAIAAA